jgi:hypothetical protein
VIYLAPGKGLGVFQRPSLGFTLGYYRTRSTLTAGADILSALPVSYLESTEINDLTSSEPLQSLMGMSLFEVAGSDHTFAVMGALVWDITSREVVGPLTSSLPPDVLSALPPTTIISEEPS